MENIAGSLILDEQVDKQLRGLQDPELQSVSLALLSVLCSKLRDEQVARVGAELPAIVACFDGGGGDDSTKANACALLTALAAHEEELCMRIAQTASAPAVQLLAETVAAAAASTSGGPLVPGSPPFNVAINATALAGALAREDSAAAQDVTSPEGLAALLALCTPAQPAPLQEAAVDTLCAAAACAEGTRPRIIAAGAVPAMAALLGDARGVEPEPRVRALMLLGMLLPASDAAQLQLASAPGGAAGLLAALRQGADSDSRVIARDLLALLGRNEGAKEALEAAVRAQVVGGGGDAEGGAPAAP